MHKFLFYNKFIIFLQTFRALYAYRQEVKIVLYCVRFSHSVGGRPVRIGQPPTEWRHQMVYNTILPPDDEHNSAQNM